MEGADRGPNLVLVLVKKFRCEPSERVSANERACTKGRFLFCRLVFAVTLEDGYNVKLWYKVAISMPPRSNIWSASAMKLIRL